MCVYIYIYIYIYIYDLVIDKLLLYHPNLVRYYMNETSLKDFASCELDELFEVNGLLLINYLIMAKLEK